MDDIEAFHEAQFRRFRAELSDVKACIKFAEYDWCNTPKSIDGSAMVYSMMLEEFCREIANSLNELVNDTKRLHAWAQVLADLKDREKVELLNGTINSQATTALNAPYAIRSRFYFAVAHLSHQANKFSAKQDWTDDLPLDGKIDKEQAHVTGKKWKSWKKLNRNLDQVAGMKFKAATDDFRNKYNHRFSPKFELGITQSVKRMSGPSIPNGFTDSMPSSNGLSGVTYAIGGSPPLMIADLVIALEMECQFFRRAFDTFRSLIHEQKDIVFGKRCAAPTLRLRS